VGVGVAVGVGVGVGVEVGVGVGVGVAAAVSVFQNPPFKVKEPPLIVFDALVSPDVPSTLMLPPLLVPPPPAITRRSIGPTASGLTTFWDGS
jgi:hypothetical protein